MPRKDRKRVYTGLTQKLTRQLERLAEHAAKQDGWMTPCFDGPKPPKSFEDFSQESRSGWESTTHFQCKYAPQIKEIVDVMQRKVGLDWPTRSEDFDARMEIWYDAVDIFWETWEGAVGLYKFWQNAMKGTKGKKHAVCDLQDNRGIRTLSKVDVSLWGSELLSCHRVPNLLVRPRSADRCDD